jgi:hypothetical protein
VNFNLLQVLIQAIPVLAAAGGLFYAAIQFRGWRTGQYVANFTKLVDLQLQLRKMIVDDPSLDPMGREDLARSPAEKTRKYYYVMIQMGVFEIAWFTHKSGQLTDDYFASWEDAMVSILKYPSFHAAWRTDQTKILHEGFRQYVDTLIEKSSVREHVRPDTTPSCAVESLSGDSERRGEVKMEPPQ